MASEISRILDKNLRKNDLIWVENRKYLHKIVAYNHNFVTCCPENLENSEQKYYIDVWHESVKKAKWFMLRNLVSNRIRTIFRKKRSVESTSIW